MTTTFNDLKDRAQEIEKKKELVKDLITQLEAVKEIDVQIKELQDKRKAVIAADVEIFTLNQEIKALSKEFSQAAKVVSKGFSFKPVVTKQYVQAAIKGDEKVAVVKDKGNAFTFLDNQFS